MPHKSNGNQNTRNASAVEPLKPQGGHRGSAPRQKKSKGIETAFMDTMGVISSNVFERFKRHPVPSLLMGAGLAWLLLEETDKGGRLEGSRIAKPVDYARQGVSSIATTTGGLATGAFEKVSGGLGAARERLVDSADSARDALYAVAESTGEHLSDGASWSREGIDEMIDRYPLAVGAAVLGLGVVAGLMAPATRREEKWLGGAARSTVESLREMGGQAVDQAVQTATAMASEMAPTPGGQRA